MSRRKTSGFNQTAQGKYLNMVSKKGIYTPEAQSEILGKTSATAGNVAESDIATRRGYLEARGMGNSIAGARTLAEPRLNQAATVADKASDITIANEQSKSAAAEEYARARMNYGNEKQNANNEAVSGLVSGLTGAAGTAINSYMGARQYQEGMNALKNIDLTKMGDGDLLALSKQYGISLDELLKMKQQRSDEALFWGDE
jgi:hypothetical protein